jgi:hypothetical protein
VPPSLDALPESRILGRVRGAMLGLLTLGTTGMSVELVLVGHYADSNQAIPLALAALALFTIAWVAIAPGIWAVRTLQLVMLLYAGAGIVGIALHFQASFEAQRELNPANDNADLVWNAITAITPPALAPGVMVQLGLLGLAYSYKHPALGEDARTASRQDS